MMDFLQRSKCLAAKKNESFEAFVKIHRPVLTTTAPAVIKRAHARKKNDYCIGIGSVNINIHTAGTGDACRSDPTEQSPTNRNAINNAARPSSSLNGTFRLFPLLDEDERDGASRVRAPPRAPAYLKD